MRQWFAALALASIAFGAQAQSAAWPQRPVRIIVPFAAGGPADVLARIVAQGLSGRIGTVLVENRPGAGGNLATDFVAKAAPDGHTLLFTVPGVVTNTFFIKDSPNVLRDLAPVVHMDNVPLVLLVNNDVPAKNVAELVSLIRAKPGGITCGSSGAIPTVACELLRSRAGADMLFVPYKGQAPATTALISGEIHVLFDVVNTAAGQVKSGRVRALAATSLKRGAPLFPDLAAVAETLPEFELVTWHGIMAPRATPADLVARLNREINATIVEPATRTRMLEQGLEIIGGSAEAFDALLKRDFERYDRLLRAAGVKPE